jgi:hypothetical protein
MYTTQGTTTYTPRKAGRRSGGRQTARHIKACLLLVCRKARHMIQASSHGLSRVLDRVGRDLCAAARVNIKLYAE